MKKIRAFIFAGLLFGITVVAAPLAFGPRGDLKFETSEFIKSTADSHPDSLSEDAAKSGAYGPFNRAFDNGKSKEWYIESQRFAFDVIGAGLAWKRRDLIDKGLHILDWGFSHQSADGSFKCPDEFHSTAFFIEAAARTALLLQASEFANDYKRWIKDVTPKILAAARWMASPSIFSDGSRGDSIYTHRYYLNADALAFAGTLGNDPSLIDLSKKLVREGISKQNPAGFNPEKDGFDTSYHAVGLVFAIRYYVIAADSETRAKMKPMISKGLEWLRSRIQPDGSIDQTGNTRTGNGQEIGRDKKPKTMSYGSASRAFADWSQVTDNPSYQKIGYELYEYGKAHPH